MAVQFAQEQNTGFVADHWVARKIVYNSKSQRLRAVYRLYKSETDYNDGKRQIQQFTFRLPGAIAGTTDVEDFEGMLDAGVTASGEELESGTIV